MYEPSSPSPRRQGHQGTRKPRHRPLEPWELKVQQIEERKKSRVKPGPPIGTRGFDGPSLAAGAGCEARRDALEEERSATRGSGK